MSDYDMSIHTNPDARAWAKFFMETWEKIGRPLPDEEMMIGWFANAIMAMHDHLKPNEAADEITRLRAEIERLRAALREIIQSAERSARNVAFRKRINFYATPLNEAWDGGALETHNILADIALAALGGGDE